MSRAIFILSLVGPLLFANDHKVCEQVNEKLYREQIKVAELTGLKEDLEKRFQEYSKEDFTAQVEGIANEIHRNKAIKVAFAKRRLTKMIDSRMRDIASTTQDFCIECRANATNQNTRDRYCENCPEHCPKNR
ncbi:MAG: hypothetical protein HYZ71_05735 [Deltaproteobacteria bacterium]|nr:hypothetical protein [Deltaproteobacteria bacterium]